MKGALSCLIRIGALHNVVGIVARVSVSLGTWVIHNTEIYLFPRSCPFVSRLLLGLSAIALPVLKIPYNRRRFPYLKPLHVTNIGCQDWHL